MRRYVTNSSARFNDTYIHILSVLWNSTGAICSRSEWHPFFEVLLGSGDEVTSQ